MKRALIYFLPFFIMLGASCVKSNSDTSSPLPQITGTFSGQFVKLRLNRTTSKYDTTKANVTLTLNLTTGYAVAGDTATVHAGSKGDFKYDPYYFGFSDKTYPTSGIPAKVHLAGNYAYAFDGKVLQLEQAYPQDTLDYYYKLTKQ